ncbi:hypothetical protein RB195_012182 [Necator americanus]|uniref:Uncharacterized protein n=1 Tax=Necator americanus TaxID=51031 RepID=A0ABR1D5X3_NECAM
MGNGVSFYEVCMRMDNYYQQGGGESHALRLVFKRNPGILTKGDAQIFESATFIHSGYSKIGIALTEEEHGSASFSSSIEELRILLYTV